MSHWRTHPKAWKCCNGHPYSHPKQSNMSVFFGGGSVLTAFVVCHKCSPASYQIGAVYAVKPSPVVFWYSVPDRETFDRLIKMDEDEVPLNKILDYLTYGEVAA